MGLLLTLWFSVTALFGSAGTNTFVHDGLNGKIGKLCGQSDLIEWQEIMSQSAPSKWFLIQLSKRILVFNAPENHQPSGHIRFVKTLGDLKRNNHWNIFVHPKSGTIINFEHQGVPTLIHPTYRNDYHLVVGGGLPRVVDGQNYASAWTLRIENLLKTHRFDIDVGAQLLVCRGFGKISQSHGCRGSSFGDSQSVFRFAGLTFSEPQRPEIEPKGYTKTKNPESTKNDLPPSPLGSLRSGIRSLPLGAQIIIACIPGLPAWLILFRALDWIGGFGGRRASNKRGVIFLCLSGVLFGISGLLWWLASPY